MQRSKISTGFLTRRERALRPQLECALLQGRLEEAVRLNRQLEQVLRALSDLGYARRGPVLRTPAEDRKSN